MLTDLSAGKYVNIEGTIFHLRVAQEIEQREYRRLYFDCKQ